MKPKIGLPKCYRSTWHQGFRIYSGWKGDDKGYFLTDTQLETILEALKEGHIDLKDQWFLSPALEKIKKAIRIIEEGEE